LSPAEWETRLTSDYIEPEHGYNEAGIPFTNMTGDFRFVNGEVAGGAVGWSETLSDLLRRLMWFVGPSRLSFTPESMDRGRLNVAGEIRSYSVTKPIGFLSARKPQQLCFKVRSSSR